MRKTLHNKESTTEKTKKVHENKIKIQQRINNLFGLDKKPFETKEQESLLGCGPQNIQSMLHFLGDKAPSISQLRKDGRVVAINNKDKIGMMPFNYTSTLNKYLNPLGYRCLMINNPSFDTIRASINKGMPVGCLMMVQSKNNPKRQGEAPESMHGYHYETIVGIGENNTVILSNPFGYDEACSENEFNQRRSLDDSLLTTRDKLLKKNRRSKTQNNIFYRKNTHYKETYLVNRSIPNTNGK